MGSSTKSIRNELSKDKMIFSEESSRAICEMGNMELIELRQTSATIQCSSCLKHVPEGLNMCQCGDWLRPNQSTMDPTRTAFAALELFLAAHARTPDVITRLAQRLDDLFVCLKSHFFIGHAFVEFSFDPVS